MEKLTEDFIRAIKKAQLNHKSESSIGVFAFFTKEEAEQALAEKKRGI